MLTVIVVCEGSTDFPVGTGIADRVILEKVEWAADLLPTLREWKGLPTGFQFLKWSRVDEEATEHGIRLHGHFNGEPGLPDAAVARRAIRLVQLAAPEARAVVLLRDSDNDPRRLLGLEQARQTSRLPLTIVIGVANTKREAWVLAGWDPDDQHEAAALEAVRSEVGFDPRLGSEQLHAKVENAKLSAKRVLSALTQDDADRERKCWEATPLDTLRTRGTENGLADFMHEIADRLTPLIGT